MTDKFRKRVREHAARLGVSYQAAHNMLRGERSASFPAAGGEAARSPSVEALLAALRAASPFTVSVGHARPQPSATASVAVENARRASQEPTYVAKTGAVERAISVTEHDELLDAGAADEVRIQVVRSFRNEQRTTFSERCRRCRSYVWCGQDEHEGTCACGQSYRIVFDSPNNWSLTQGWRCMDCGTVHEMTQPHEGRNPWHTVNERQVQCDACFRIHPNGTRAAEARGHREKAVAAAVTASPRTPGPAIMGESFYDDDAYYG